MLCVKALLCWRKIDHSAKQGHLTACRKIIITVLMETMSPYL